MYIPLIFVSEHTQPMLGLISLGVMSCSRVAFFGTSSSLYRLVYVRSKRGQ